MKVVLLAGGFGTRLSEETVLKPKPMVEIGGKPILWHIMKQYSHFGHNEFIICCGYKGYMIKEYFANYFLHQSDVTFDLSNNEMKIHRSESEPWKVTLVDTGLNSQTGHRIKMIEKHIDDTFLLTYGDGVSNVDIDELVKFHYSHEGIGTMTSVQPEGRFGVLDFDSDSGKVNSFQEKPKGDGHWINGGFFVFDKKFFSYLNEDSDLILEREPLEKLTEDSQLFTFKHHGFWKCMDTVRDKQGLEKLWENNPPWKVWN